MTELSLYLQVLSGVGPSPRYGDNIQNILDIYTVHFNQRILQRQRKLKIIISCSVFDFLCESVIFHFFIVNHCRSFNRILVFYYKYAEPNLKFITAYTVWEFYWHHILLWINANMDYLSLFMTPHFIHN